MSYAFLFYLDSIAKRRLTLALSDAFPLFHAGFASVIPLLHLSSSALRIFGSLKQDLGSFRVLSLSAFCFLHFSYPWKVSSLYFLASLVESAFLIQGPKQFHQDYSYLGFTHFYRHQAHLASQWLFRSVVC